MALRNWVEEYEANEDGVAPTATSPSHPPGLEEQQEDVGRTYVTISQAANEKAQQAANAAILQGAKAEHDSIS